MIAWSLQKEEAGYRFAARVMGARACNTAEVHAAGTQYAFLFTGSYRFAKHVLHAYRRYVDFGFHVSPSLPIAAALSKSVNP